MNRLMFFIGLSFCLAACNEDKVTEVPKDGAIETVITVSHIDNDFDIIKTTHKVWNKNGIVKNFIHLDTIPSLKNTIQEAENSQGDVKTVRIPKDYEIFITVN